jgi:O-acetyl-ADP-ribose deacetylase (regulator of RNase III)
MIAICKGSIFGSKAQCLVVPVNCVGVAGKGLALEFKKRFPSWFSDYAYACKNQLICPGDAYYYKHDGIVFYSVATKDGWKNPSRLEWVSSGLAELASDICKSKYPSVAIPALGCGLGGLAWADVEPLITAAAMLMPPETVVEVYPPK